jgi:hypothetical protein
VVTSVDGVDQTYFNECVIAFQSRVHSAHINGIMKGQFLIYGSLNFVKVPIFSHYLLLLAEKYTIQYNLRLITCSPVRTIAFSHFGFPTNRKVAGSIPD